MRITSTGQAELDEQGTKYVAFFLDVQNYSLIKRFVFFVGFTKVSEVFSFPLEISAAD